MPNNLCLSALEKPNKKTIKIVNIADIRNFIRPPNINLSHTNINTYDVTKHTIVTSNILLK
jgi:hypothetical protein